MLGSADLRHRLLQAADERRRDRTSDLVVDRCGNGDEQRGDGQNDADVFDRALTALGLQEMRLNAAGDGVEALGFPSFVARVKAGRV